MIVLQYAASRYPAALVNVQEIMKTILKPCRVPWWISPTSGCVTITHTETDVAPGCIVVFGGGRLQDDDKTDNRRIEITFDDCYFARTGPHSDTEDIESIGYELTPKNDALTRDGLGKYIARWRSTGICPDSRFYVATQSAWLENIPELYRNDCRHYVVYGRDGHVELIARGFRWREWKWLSGHLDDAPKNGAIVGEGAGVE